jgi:hypothetical protein
MEDDPIKHPSQLQLACCHYAGRHVVNRESYLIRAFPGKQTPPDHLLSHLRVGNISLVE